MKEIEFNDFIEDKYRHTDEFHNGLAAVQNTIGLWGFINKKGEEVIPCQFADANSFSNGLAAVKNKDGLWGYINKSGILVITYNFSCVQPFSNGLAAVRGAGCWDWVYINKKGKTVETDNTFVYASQFYDGFACVKIDNNKYSYIDENGKMYGHYFFYASDFDNGYALIKKDINGPFQVINKCFSIVKEFDKEDADIVASSLTNLSEGLIVFKGIDSRRFGYMDKDFNIVIPDILTKACEFHDNLAIVTIDNKSIGIARTDGRIQILAKTSDYHQLKGFSEGLCAVRNSKNLWGYIDKTGKEVIPCKYLDADSFSEGLAGVTDEDGSLKFIDKKGNIVIDLGKTYNSCVELEDKAIAINANSEEELAKKKLLVLGEVRNYLISNATKQVDDTLSDLQSEICETEIGKKAAK